MTTVGDTGGLPHVCGRGADQYGMSDAPEVVAVGRSELVRALERIEDEANYGRAHLAEIEEHERSAVGLGDAELIWRARLLQADLAGRAGQLAVADRSRDVWRVNEYATVSGNRRLQARSHRVLALIRRDIGDLAGYLDHAVKAVGVLDEDAPASIRALHLICLADALAECGSPSEAWTRYDEAEEVAVRGGDVTRQVCCLNNRAYGEYVAGDLEQANTTISRLVELCRVHGESVWPATLDTIARIDIDRGQYAEAVTAIRQAIKTYHELGLPELMAPAGFLLTLAAAQRHLGDDVAAQQSVDECRALGEANDLGYVLALVDEEQAQLYASRGDFERAYACHLSFHRADKALLSEKRAAQARLQLAMLETIEIRAEADRFRDAALRDPLTGLQNRRFLDQILPGLLARRGPGQVLAAALVDLDHFKRVNDQCSHAAGDEVLIAVGQLMNDAVTVGGAESAQEGFAARIGGEEFVIVLTGSAGDDLADPIKALRRAVAERDWKPITGDVPVTISVGLCWATTDDSQFTLLRRADELLYAAKNTGRNRVCTEPAHVNL
jgi:diguanylate cyclase (GGDEF)-like protein